MSKPTIMTIDNEEFYLADDLCEYDKAYFLGCAKTVRKIVEKKKIPDTAYEYLTKKKTGYEYSTVEYKKAKLAIKRKWVEKNMPSMSNGKIKEQFATEPNKIILSKKELVDLDGNEMNLTIVGEREYDKCYFRVKDVAEYFESPKLSDTITRKDKEGYIEEKHYVYFIRSKTASGGNSPNNKVLYLTYCGLIRFLFTSRNKKAESFQEWASKILFTHQVGTQEQKQKLIKSLIGVDVTNALESLTTSVSDIACVYLLVIDTVEKLRSKMKIPDDFEDASYVCKYGETDDLRRRIGEHKKTYSEYNDNIKLKYYSMIDVSNVTKAETSMRNKFENMGVACDLIGQKELIILDKQQLKDVSNIYEETGIIYGASLKDYKSQTEKKISELEHQYDIDTTKLKSETELLKKDIQILTKDKELMQMEIDKLKKKLKKYNKKK
jgi:hypothetical protein